jgi:general stress protein 26
MGARDAEEIQKVWKIARSTRVAILTMQDEAGEMNARPMLSLPTEDGDSIWFITDRNSPKMSEIGEGDQALLNYSDVASGDYLVFTGRISAVDDREKLKAMWSKGDELFFPEGPTDKNAILLRFEPTEAEYWTGGAGAIKFALKYVKMKLTGSRASMGEHGHVKL